MVVSFRTHFFALTWPIRYVPMGRTATPTLPGGELFSTVQNRYGQISYSYLVPNISFNFKDAMCQTVCTRHGLQEGWVFCALHAV